MAVPVGCIGEISRFKGKLLAADLISKLCTGQGVVPLLQFVMNVLAHHVGALAVNSTHGQPAKHPVLNQGIGLDVPGLEILLIHPCLGDRAEPGQGNMRIGHVLPVIVGHYSDNL